jgi:hypothetical protein
MSICEMWLRDPLINPRTGRVITRNGPTFVKLERECGKKSRSREDCHRWHKNPLKNPTTQRRIRAGAAVYKSLENECGKNRMHYARMNIPKLIIPQSSIAQFDTPSPTPLYTPYSPATELYLQRHRHPLQFANF